MVARNSWADSTPAQATSKTASNSLLFITLPLTTQRPDLTGSIVADCPKFPYPVSRFHIPVPTEWLRAARTPGRLTANRPKSPIIGYAQRLFMGAAANTIDLDREEFWEDLLAFVEEKRVIPVVGPELLVTGHAIESRSLYRVVAERLL